MNRTKKTKRGFLAVLFVIFIIMTAFSGCGTPGRGGNAGSISVMIVGDETNMQIGYAALLRAFAKESGVQIETISCKDSREQSAVLEKMLEKGEFPDVVLMNGYSMIDVPMLAKDGLLLDLDPYMEASDDFSRDDFYAALLEAGYFLGGQYIMPVGFQVPLIISSDERMDKYGLDLSGMTGRETLKYLDGFIDDYRGEAFAKVYYHSVGISNDTFLYSFLGLDFFDYDAMDAAYDPEDIRLAVDFYKKMEGDAAANIDFSRVTTFQSAMDTSSRNSAVQLAVNGGHLSGILTFYQQYFTSLDENMRVFGLPRADAANEYTGIISAYGVVSAQTGEPFTALKLLKYIAEEIDMRSFTARMPASKTTMEGMLGDPIAFSSFVLLPDEQKGELGLILEGVTDAAFMNNWPVTRRMFTCFGPYLNSEKPFEECLADFDAAMISYKEQFRVR